MSYRSSCSSEDTGSSSAVSNRGLSLRRCCRAGSLRRRQHLNVPRGVGGLHAAHRSDHAGAILGVEPEPRWDVCAIGSPDGEITLRHMLPRPVPSRSRCRDRRRWRRTRPRSPRPRHGSIAKTIRLARAISAPCSAARCACRWPTLTTSRAVVVEDRIQHSTATSPAVQPGPPDRMHTHNNHR